MLISLNDKFFVNPDDIAILMESNKSVEGKPIANLLMKGNSMWMEVNAPYEEVVGRLRGKKTNNEEGKHAPAETP